MDIRKTLAQPRVRLVPAQVEDTARIVAALQPGATQNLSFFAHDLTVKRQQAYIQRMRGDEHYLWVVERLSDGALIGTAGLHEIDRSNHNARLGLLIFRPEDRGQGYGTEVILQVLDRAFGGFAMHKVYLKVFTDNIRSTSHYMKLGFTTMEGILRQEYELHGVFKDMFRLAIFRQDWLALVWYDQPK